MIVLTVPPEAAGLRTDRWIAETLSALCGQQNTQCPLAEGERLMIALTVPPEAAGLRADRWIAEALSVLCGQQNTQCPLAEGSGS